MRLLTFILLGLCLSTQAQTEKKGNVLTDANDKAKLVMARQKLLAGDYVSALNMYREVLNHDPSDASVKYYVGLCQFNLQKINEARTTLEEARNLKDVKPETYMVLAKIYQMDERFEEAIALVQQYNTKIGNEGSEEEKKDAELVLSQCTNAVNFLKSPAKVNITNLGDGVNSKYDDKNPCMSADGKTLIFTTRRPETTSSPTDVEGDGKYFEDIFISSADSLSGEFKSAGNVSRSINTAGHDACTSISPDGKQIFIYKNDAGDRASRGGNVFVSKIQSGKWKKPEPLGKPVNTSYWEGGACISPDGNRLFFTSEREGGFGNSDIWMVTKKNKEEWDKPVNLGEAVNTPYDEAGMFLAPDGKTLFFCSNGPRSMGSYDIFRTTFENGKWTPAQNLGYPINSVAKEGQLTISANASTAYLSSTRKGGLGESDLYKVDLKDYAILEKDFTRGNNGLSVLRGTIREGSEGYGMPDVEIILKSASGEERKTSTGETGEYFYTLPAGSYTLTVKKKGYKEITEELSLQKSEKGSTVTEKGYLLHKQ